MFKQVGIHLSFQNQFTPSGYSFHPSSDSHRSPTDRQPIIDKLLDYIESNGIKREEHMTHSERSDQKYNCLKKSSWVYSRVDSLQFGKQYNTYYKFHFMLLSLSVYSKLKKRDSNKSLYIQ